MPFEAGQQLLHYRLLEKIGEGGMGQVWKAADEDLRREVAIKLVPDVFSGDADRLARFEREARLLASLSHPGIAAVFGLHECDGARFLAMEYVEGEDLEVRLARGPLPLELALEVASGVSEALAAAHDAGVIHRDLKPANVILTPDSKVKVLDFGLAKALAGTPASGVDPGSSLSPTLTSGGTRAGMILGTAAYMSPEQARGKPVDRRADLWALGCLIYEILTAKKAFAGATFSDTLASVLRAEPDWDALPQRTPASIRRLLRRLLEKDPAKRMRDAGDARLEIDAAAEEAAAYDPAEASTSTPQATAAPRRQGWGWALGGAVAATLVLLAAWAAWRSPPAQPPPVSRFEIVAAPEPAKLDPWSLALSPDGRRVAWVVVEGGERAIWIRELDGLEAQRLPDTAGAQRPTFSPDGRSLAYYAKGKLRRLDLGSRRAIDLCDAAEGAGISWGADGAILFNDNWLSALSRVPAEGGAVQPATRLDEEYGEIGHWFPQLLPDGKRVLISRWRTTLNDMNVAVASLDTGEIRDIVSRASFARFVPPDRLLFTRAGAVHAVHFDPDTLEVSGEPVVVVDGIEQRWDNGGSTWAVSTDGTLAYLPGSLWTTQRAVVRVSREGEPRPLDLPAGSYLQVALSPDGGRLALTEFSNGRANVVVHDLSRGLVAPVPVDGISAHPVWGPNGKELLFNAAGKGPWDILLFVAGGGLPPRPLVEDETDQIPLAWSSDRRFIVWDENYAELRVRDLENGQTRTIAKVPSTAGAALSPDARWIAYGAQVSGRGEILVRRFPDGDRDYRVSVEGGKYPLWGRDGREILYRRGDAVLAVPVRATGDALTAGRPQLLFRDRRLVEPWRHGWSYDRESDSLVTIQRGESEVSRDRFVVVLNWPSMR